MTERIKLEEKDIRNTKYSYIVINTGLSKERKEQLKSQILQDHEIVNRLKENYFINMLFDYMMRESIELSEKGTYQEMVNHANKLSKLIELQKIS